MPRRAAVPALVALCAGVAAAWSAPAVAALQDEPGPARVYDGRAGQLAVDVPRFDESIDVNGHLDEPVWARAARLTGFSKYSPVDGAAADQPTDVLVWYSPGAIHFGVRAVAPAAEIRATLADRDRLDTDDQVVFFLGTYHDGRQAFVFAVNPLGAQADGALVEGTRTQQGGFSGLASGREPPDLSQDFVFESRGRLTPEGYEVEVRIPFKSLRYQKADTQTWGFNVTRVMRATGREDSWTPARRDGASFLAQSGRLEGLTGLRRGLVLDLNPFVTARTDGRRDGDAWRYDLDSPDAGVNVRWGVTPTLTLNGTVKPDFSQVEADAGQFQYDPRQAVFFAEKRPFFLDGLEQFTTPNNLVYTRRIVEPVVAAKLTGKAATRTSLAVLAAVDDQALSRTRDDHPAFLVARVQQDVGGQSKLGFVYTERQDGRDSNRVAGVDTRLVFGEIYAVQAQAAASRTRVDGAVTTAPLWQVTATRSGRHYAFRYNARGVDEAFDAQAGFVSRAGVANVQLTNQAIVYGRESSALERWTADLVLDGVWRFDDFVGGRAALDRKLHVNTNAVFRGGWTAGASVLVETFGYDDDLYADYALGEHTPDGLVLRPFVGTPRLPNLDYVASASTPQRGGVALDAFFIWGKDENFFEWASADIVFANVGLVWRPTERLRADARYQLQRYERRTDGSVVGRRRIPRAKVEYQVTRSIFVRLVGEFDSQFRDDLRDDSRTDLPIYIRDARSGLYERALRQQRDTFRLDALFSYQPTPGTVVFAGYGNRLAEPNDVRAPRLRRVSDGFFLKVSYLFRL